MRTSLKNPNIALHTWIDFEVVRELAAEPGHFDRLALAESTHVAGRDRQRLHLWTTT
jgi:hypothetical protein